MKLKQYGVKNKRIVLMFCYCACPLLRQSAEKMYMYVSHNHCFVIDYSLRERESVSDCPRTKSKVMNCSFCVCL